MDIEYITGFKHGLFGELRNNRPLYDRAINKYYLIRDGTGRWFRDTPHVSQADTSEIIGVIGEAVLGSQRAMIAQARQITLLLKADRTLTPNSIRFEGVKQEQNNKGGIIISGEVCNDGDEIWTGWGVHPLIIDAIGIRILENENLIGEQRHHFPFEIIPPGGRRNFTWVFTSIDSKIPPGTYDIELDLGRFPKTLASLGFLRIS
jgi:hypothetical protein